MEDLEIKSGILVHLTNICWEYTIYQAPGLVEWIQWVKSSPWPSGIHSQRLRGKSNISIGDVNYIASQADDRESACSVGDLGSIPGLGWSPGEGNGYPLLENSMDRGAWQAPVHGVAKSQTKRLSLSLKSADFGSDCLNLNPSSAPY